MPLMTRRGRSHAMCVIPGTGGTLLALTVHCWLASGLQPASQRRHSFAPPHSAQLTRLVTPGGHLLIHCGSRWDGEWAGERQAPCLAAMPAWAAYARACRRSGGHAPDWWWGPERWGSRPSCCCSRGGGSRRCTVRHRMLRTSRPWRPSGTRCAARFSRTSHCCRPGGTGCTAGDRVGNGG